MSFHCAKNTQTKRRRLSISKKITTTQIADINQKKKTHKNPIPLYGTETRRKFWKTANKYAIFNIIRERYPPELRIKPRQSDTIKS